MSFENKDMTGAMFKNDKTGNPKRPDYRGASTVRGEKFRLSGWLQHPGNDENRPKYLKLKAEPFQETAGGAQRQGAYGGKRLPEQPDEYGELA